MSGEAEFERLRELLDADALATFLGHVRWGGYRQWWQRHGKRLGLTREAVTAAGKWARKNPPADPEPVHEATWEPASVTVETRASDDGAIVVTTTGDIRTLAELYERCQIDADRHQLTDHRIKAWTTGMKDAKGRIQAVQQYSVSATLKPRLSHHVRKVQPARVTWQRLAPSQQAGKADGILTAVVFGDIQTGFAWSRDMQRLIPYHDRRALDVMAQLVDWLQPETVALVGDNLDLPEVSKYSTPVDAYQTLQASIDEHHILLTRLRGLVPEAHIVENVGNHDHRFRQALEDKVPALASLGKAGKNAAERSRHFSIRELLGYDALGIVQPSPVGEFHDERGTYDTPAVMFPRDEDCSPLTVHGTNHGKNASGSLADAYPDRCVVQGHVHKFAGAAMTKQLPLGGQRVTWHHTIGCLCHVDGRVPGFKGPRNWQQGGAIVTHDLASGESWFEPVLIRGGEAIVRGRRFVGEDYGDKVAEALDWPQMASRAA